jgi:hypothetical protein
MIERERRASSVPVRGDDGGFLAAVADAVAELCSDEDESNDENNNSQNIGCLPLQQQKSSSSSTSAHTPLSLSPAAWLEDTFATDPTDQLLGSFTCAYAAHILIQGKLFIVRGVRGARVLFFSNIMRYGVAQQGFGCFLASLHHTHTAFLFYVKSIVSPAPARAATPRMITTRELNLADIAAVRKVHRVGTISALELTRREDGKSFVFCSFLYRENAFQCMQDAWLTVAASPKPRGGEAGEGEEEEGIELEDMTGWRAMNASAAATADARSLTASYAGSEDSDGGDDGGGGRRGPRGSGSSVGSASGSRSSRGSRGGSGSSSRLKRCNSAPLTLLHASMDTHADASTVLRREMPYRTPPHVFYTLYDAKGSLLAAHLTSNCNVTDLKISPKTPFGRGGGNDIAERFISYCTPVMFTFPNMPKFCTVNDTQRYVTPRADADDDEEEENDDDDDDARERGRGVEKAWVMHSSAAMCGAPYSDAFTIETRLRVSASAAPEGGTAVEVTFKIAWKKTVNSLLKGLISKGAKDQLKRSYGKMLDLMTARLSEESVSNRIRVIRSATFCHTRSPSAGSGMQQQQAALLSGASRERAAAATVAAVGAAAAAAASARTGLAVARVPEEEETSSIDGRNPRLSRRQISPDNSWFVPAVVILATVVLAGFSPLVGVTRWFLTPGGEGRTTAASSPLLPPLLSPLPLSETCGCELNLNGGGGGGGVTREVVRAALHRVMEDDALIDTIASLINNKNEEE